MGVCENCGSALDPAWKFCIHCGDPIPNRLAGVLSAAAIPSAIRPDAAVAIPQRKRVDVPLLVGIALALGGAGMIVYLAVLFLLPHG